MEIKFLKSSNSLKTCPENNLPEFAFIGRSNVGKSSLINMISGNKGTAKISSKPGKTKLINHFLVDNAWSMVDLPGYGYARTSKTELSHFDELIKSYIASRQNLYCLFVLIDSRHEPMKKDLDFLLFVGELEVHFAIIFTKTDKVSSNQVHSNISKFKKAILENWEEMPPYFTSSTVEKKGREEVLAYINGILNSGKVKHKAK